MPRRRPCVQLEIVRSVSPSIAGTFPTTGTGASAWKTSAAPSDKPETPETPIATSCNEVTQTAACNAHHELAPRLARWLMTAPKVTRRSASPWRIVSAFPIHRGVDGPLFPSAHLRGWVDRGAEMEGRGPWGWRLEPEGHRADSRPMDAREREQLSRSSESSVRRLFAADGPRRRGRLRRTAIVTGKAANLATIAGLVPLCPKLRNLPTNQRMVQALRRYGSKWYPEFVSKWYPESVPLWTIQIFIVDSATLRSLGGYWSAGAI